MLKQLDEWPCLGTLKGLETVRLDFYKQIITKLTQNFLSASYSSMAQRYSYIYFTVHR